MSKGKIVHAGNYAVEVEEDKTYYWWNSQNIQNIRKLYLINFFKVEKNWFNKWSNFIAVQKKKVFN